MPAPGPESILNSVECPNLASLMFPPDYLLGRTPQRFSAFSSESLGSRDTP